MKQEQPNTDTRAYIREFITAICEGNLSTANKHLEAAVQAKLKGKIKSISKEN